MNFADAVKTCFTKYLDFNGRASRSEFWWFTLFYLLGAVVTSIISTVLYFIFALAILLPAIAVGVRRLHDTNRSGWWMLISLIPLIGLVLIYFYVLESDAGENNFGAPAGA